MSTAAPRRPDASMTLLTEMMERPLDPAYAAEAERRVARGLSPTPPPRPLRIAAILLVLALVITIAALALRQPRAVIAEQKADLISRIEERQQAGDAQRARAATLNQEIATARGQLLAAQDLQTLNSELAAAELGTGAIAVSGPGVVITLDDSAQAAGSGAAGDPRAAGDVDQGRVQARDLAIVANGLWQAGAEAVSINGHRLTSLSAIRFAGDALIVDFRPLTRPYVVSAIGEKGQLHTRFVGTDAGSYAQGLADNYGVRYSVDDHDQLTLPADPSMDVRVARVPGAGPSAAATSGAAPTTATNTPAATTTATTTKEAVSP
ncbi:DUF881 domain-containing protein [Arsenicicoccus piscis]|nr:DUF881 domain-containing protein [Arsenicicoccus piscis]